MTLNFFRFRIIPLEDSLKGEGGGRRCSTFRRAYNARIIYKFAMEMESSIVCLFTHDGYRAGSRFEIEKVSSHRENA